MGEGVGEGGAGEGVRVADDTVGDGITVAGGAVIDGVAVKPTGMSVIAGSRGGVPGATT